VNVYIVEKSTDLTKRDKGVDMLKCNRCGKEAIYLQRYSGEAFCGGCFIEFIENRVKRTISKYDLFQPEDRISVALSGGKDSMALLHILSVIESSFPKSELIAITIDEGILGYREESIKIASEICKKLNIEHVITSFKEIYGHTLDELVERIQCKEGFEPCSVCGVLRRKALNLLAKKVHADKLATAHNMDDEIQTLLINLINGDVMRIARVEPLLKGKKFVPRAKPLCEVPENEVALYSFLRQIKFQSIGCPYIRTSLRNDIRNAINKLELNHPGIKYNIYRAFEKIRPILKSSNKDFELKECKKCGEPSSRDICASCLLLLKSGVVKI